MSVSPAFNPFRSAILVQNFNQTRHQFEIHLENGSQVEPVQDEAEIPQLHFNVSAGRGDRCGFQWAMLGAEGLLGLHERLAILST